SPHLLDVPAHVVNQADDVVVVERVEGVASSAADAHESRPAKQAQLMGNGRLAQADERRQIEHAALAAAERVDNPHTRRVGEQLEQVSHDLDGAGVQKARALGGKTVRVET